MVDVVGVMVVRGVKDTSTRVSGGMGNVIGRGEVIGDCLKGKMDSKKCTCPEMYMHPVRRSIHLYPFESEVYPMKTYGR